MTENNYNVVLSVYILILQRGKNEKFKENSNSSKPFGF